jgi:D-3-phosphoglycerate dehydrogenase / 2-oxoglutarate reductase
LGIRVHTVKGYGDTAVAECTIGLMWAAAKSLAYMDREIRAGHWARSEGLQLRDKRLGLIGFGGVATEVARIANGIGMEVVAWSRTQRPTPGVDFIELDTLLATCHVVSLHLTLDAGTQGFLSRERIAAMKPGAILVNTARGALIDEAALVEALQAGRLAGAGLDVFPVEPLPRDSVLTTLPNVVLSAHSAFRTAEASDNLIEAALDHCRRIAAGH